jgi:transketolase
MRGDLPENWRDTAAQTVEVLARQTAPQATRQSSQAALNALAPALPEILGGSADLTTSNSTFFKGAQTIVPQEDRGDYLHFGVREFGMTGFMNGVAAHGGFIPYGGTFLVFSDYARNAVRLACLMEQRVILVYTHDSIGLGEDGPTHQPIEQLASLRAIPHLGLWRPCDAAETAVAWTLALERRGPTALVLTRQGLAQQPRTAAQLAAIRRGGYVLIECSGTPEALVIATGSEIGIAATAVNALNAAGRRVRLVSMPSTDTFDAQDDGWREGVLPRAVTRRLAVEAGVTQCWWRYVGSTGRVLGIERFGASGKGPDVLAHFGFTADNVARQLRALLEV